MSSVVSRERMFTQPDWEALGREGPLTRATVRRSLIVYAALCVTGLLPMFFGGSPGAESFGLGLWMPGAGFIGAGGWWVLLFPLTLVLFAGSLIAWFGAGMVIAPVIVWLGTSLLAAAATGGAIWSGAPYVVPVLTAVMITFQWRRIAAHARADRVQLEARKQFLPHALDMANARAVAAPDVAQRELTQAQLGMARYALDRALQPIGDLNGYDHRDQFQTAALRYQVNHLGFGLAMLQCHYTPNFQGYLGQAQRNLIEQYLQRRIWNYWLYETAWGHLNVTNFDPANRDNIMLTGWLGLHVNLYMLASGDRRYAEPGSLTFRLNDRTAYPHDTHTLAHSVEENFRRAKFCLYPCEPNWIYPICNHYGMTSLVAHDTLFGTRFVEEHLDHWLHRLDNEFTDAKGSIIGLRSELTGWVPPFPSGELSYANFTNTFAPDRAWRLWAIARTELEGLVRRIDGQDVLEFPGEGFDFGNYKRGHVASYGGALSCAREFGDEEFAAAIQRGLDRNGGLNVSAEGRRYTNGSNLANAVVLQGLLLNRDDYGQLVTQGPAESTRRGPMLTDASYPDVLVARAFSRGEDLELTLYPGKLPGKQSLKIERLQINRPYAVTGATTDTIVADGNGVAKIDVDLNGRTPVNVKPV